MHEQEVDVAVIGAGSAGLTAWRAARTHTARVVLVEEGQYGTTCARVGCMPSKLLIAAANAAYEAKRASALGIHVQHVRVDGQAVMRRLRAERDRFVQFAVDNTEAIPAEARLMGHARFLAPGRVQVGEHTVLKARTVVVATGSQPFIPPEFKDAGVRLHTSDSVFEWTRLPASVAVIGTGVIALELGQALHRLGSRVTLFGRGTQVGFLDDPGLASLSTSLFSVELPIKLRCEVVRVEQKSNGVALRLRNHDGDEWQEEFEAILCATGRQPRLQGLDLQKAGLELDRKGVPRVDPQTMRCGDSAVFIAGDASDERAVLHEAVDQGRVAGDNAGAWPEARPAMRHVPLAIAFTEPQLAQVGMGWKAMQGTDYVVGSVSFSEQGRSRVMLEDRGALHLYAERGNGRLLGAQMVGPRAEHLAHLLAWSLQQGLSIEQMLRMPYYHPVFEEAVRTAVKDARDQLRRPPPPIEHCDDCTPGV
jgi:dihydrolipoamide dehydrogenase